MARKIKKIILILCVGSLVNSCSYEESLADQLNIKSQSDLDTFSMAAGDGSRRDLYAGTYVQSEYTLLSTGECGNHPVALAGGSSKIESGGITTVSISENGHMVMNTSGLGDYSGALHLDTTFTLLGGHFDNSSEYTIELVNGIFSSAQTIELELQIEIISKSNGINCRINGESTLDLTKPII